LLRCEKLQLQNEKNNQQRHFWLLTNPTGMPVRTCALVHVRVMSTQTEIQITRSCDLPGITAHTADPEKPLEAKNTNLAITQIFNFDHFWPKKPGKITF